MTQNWKEKMNQSLSDLAADIPVYTGCFFFWGEVEMPACLKEELEIKQGGAMQE